MESEEQKPNLFEQPAKRDYTLLRQIITWTIVLSLVGVLGFYCYRSSVQQSALDAEKDREKKEKQDLEKQAGEQRSEIAIKSFHQFISTEFPGWTLEGDNLAAYDLSDDLTSESAPNGPGYFFAQLSQNGKSRVIRLGFINLKRADGSQYWAVYRPTTITIGNLELEEVNAKEFKAGQENPPEPEPDY